ncbi:glycosyltransferase family 4 protein [Nocardioides sp. BSK12Z-4]|uniref:Glycosyltransferase family 4 protein n=1 Tax=Nocardioides bruguierae TaxID=2945102 RepID=A0A9X2IHI6_9ACTN|nr:glycosyltransferase family 4 protein [Nocardioides bruguierae]MCM0621835.1 glycosyltransferase family 4 protein [Nocardioides bruguierae]
MSATSAVMRLRSEFSTSCFDVVVARSLPSALIVSAISKRLAGTKVWSVHDRLATDYLKSEIWTFLLSRIFPKFFTGIIANSRATLDTIHISQSQNWLVVPPGIDVAAWNPADGGDYHESGATIFVVLGRISPWKGQELAIRAFHEVRLRNPETRLRIIGAPIFGEEGYLAELVALASELDLLEHISFEGHSSSPHETLQGCHVLVHSSTVPEPFGSVVVEGMASGLVVIASGEGGPVEVIGSGENGFLYEPRSVSSLATAMQTVLNMDDASRRKMAQLGMQRASKFDIATLAHEQFVWLEGVSSGHGGSYLSSSLR